MVSRPRHKKIGGKPAGRSWTGRQLAESKEARDELLRVVAGGPGEHHVRAWLARYEEHWDHERQGTIDAETLRPYLPAELGEAAANHYANLRKVAADVRHGLERAQPGLIIDATLGRKIRDKNRRAAQRPRREGTLNDAIRQAATRYRRTHPYSRSEYSTRALARHIANVLRQPMNSIRRHLAAINIR